MLIEMGKLDEAEATLLKAVRRNPEDRNAFYYLSVIKEARYAQEARKREISAKDALIQVEKSWNVPISREQIGQPQSVHPDEPGAHQPRTAGDLSEARQDRA